MTTKTIATAFVVALLLCASAYAQTTAFTYQGSLKDGASPANGNYDFEFKLFDAVSGGAQQGSAIQQLNVAVASGIFTVSLDFGAGTLPGADRFLDIAVRAAGGGVFTALGPRQKVNSAPYSIKSLNSATADNATNSTQLGGVAANQFVVTTDPRMTDARPPTAGSTNYVQNTISPQTSSNFNVSGTGTANIFNAVTQYNIGGSRILSNAGTRNLFAGVAVGQSNTSGSDDSFFGFGAGQTNVNGFQNSYFGSTAGQNSGNTNNNAFFGFEAGHVNQLGSANSFFGASAGVSNTSGSGNTIIGYRADVVGPPPFGNPNPSNATAIGANSQVTQSNSLVLGSINGINGAAADTNVGIGTTAPLSRLQVVTANDTNPGNITAWDSRHFVVGSTASSGGVGISYDQTNNVGYFGTVHPNVGWGNLILQSGGGNIGIGTGTTAPTYKLEINSPANKGLRVLTNTSGGTIASFGGLGDFVIDTVSTVGGRVTVKENGNVGIGTNNPNTKLQVAGSVYIANPSSLIITSPNGACWFITVNNAGALSTISVTCP